MESGFVVEFSDTIDTSVLNLYDSESEALGDADVTLEGASTGSISGSLVVEDNELTFVATGGVLAADTYTVTLRSASDGIIDEALGELLDGEYSGSFSSGDGTAGGDFVYSFSVDEPEDLVISVADFARGPTQAVQAPAQGSSEELPDGLLVNFSDADGVTSGTLTITYDPELLTITAVEAGPDAPSDMLIEVNLTEEGVAVIAFEISGDPMESGAADLLQIIAEVPSDAEYGAVQVLDISDVEINAGAIDATADDAVHAVIFVGDANGNATYDTEDARLIARVGMGLDSGFAIDQPTLSDDYEILFPTIDPNIIGDVTGKESLSALDASDILRCITGLDTPNIPEIPDLIAPTASISPNGTSVSADITFTITFDEDVTGVDVDDLTVTGSLGSTLTLSNFTAVSATTYTVDVSGMSRGEKVTLKLTASGSDIEDTSGNALVTNASAYVTYTKNTAPTAGADTATADEDDTAVIIDVLDNDDDYDTSDTLSVSSVDATSTKGATITLKSDGTLSYNASTSDTLGALADGESTTDTFQYTVSDGQGGTDTATVTVTITGVNDDPVAYSDTAKTDSDTAVDIDVLANDTDADTSDTLSIASFDSTSEEGATITQNSDGTLNYDPTSSSTLSSTTDTVTDSFTYTLTDGNTGSTITGTVTVILNSSDTGETGTTYIVLDGDSIAVDGSGATASGSTVTITAAGIYSISGTLDDGQIIVDSSDEEDVNLVLNGVDITCSDSAPIYVISAYNAVITLAEGTDNYVTDGDTYTYESSDVDEPDAAIFSADDLKFNGTGSLTVVAKYNNGIVSKDDLDIYNGTITVTAVNHGIKGKDSVEIVDGTVTVTAGGDGIQSSNDEDETKGYVSIQGGTIDITADSDGIQAETTITITGGDLTVSAGGGSSSSDTESGKGLKAGAGITIEAGTVDTGSVDVDSADDAIHTDGAVVISAGDITLASGDDAIHSETSVTITGGEIDITTSYEGIDAPVVSIDDAVIDIVATGDGISASSEDGSSSTVSVAGGTLSITAGEDGIQAEAQLLISGGTISVTTGGGSSKSVSSDATAKGLKADTDIVIQGGTITISSADDAIHAGGDITISGGDITISSGDDGIHADTSITITGGEIDITKSYEGIEASVITIDDGTIHVVSSDDGINVAGGNDGSSPNSFNSSSSRLLEINGGYIVVNATGDGLDSNGSITMTGGTVIVHGPTASMNGALDYDGTFNISGGFLIAVGSSGMAESPSSSSSQDTLDFSYGSTQSAGTMVHIETEDGEEILTFVPLKAYQSVVLCTADIESGTTYVVYSGGSSTGTEADGLYTGGTYTAGTELGSVTA